MIHRFAERIHFVQLRNVAVPGERGFHEVAHTGLAGNVDRVTVMDALVDSDYPGPLRPDHAITGE